VNILFNYPMPEMLAHLASKNFNGIRRGLSYRMLTTAPSGIFAGYAYALPRIGRRKAVRRSTLALYERIRRRGPVRLADAGLDH
jgi:hypothetical protein